MNKNNNTTGRSAKRMDRKSVMAWLEGLAQDDWRMFHSDSEVQEIARNAFELLKEQELPTELKQKKWNAFYAEEDKYEKKFVGKEEHLNWFIVYRPWLQKGFDIAIDAIADWEGR